MIFYLDEVQKKLGYSFKDAELLRQCFTHKSYSDEAKGELNNERLEFLGDSVLGLVVTEYLYKSSKQNEGSMTNLKQQFVSCKPLANAIKKLKIEEYMLKNSSMNEVSDNIRENLFESIVGGIYLDGGLEKARAFIYQNLLTKTKIILESKSDVNYKGKLNEYIAKKKLGQIEYQEVSKIGQDHNPQFKMQVLLNGEKLVTASGKSKKKAEQACAKKALDKLKNKKITKSGK
ncbi:MAG: ribonuclease III [Clostridia bacterium]|nr:ribonuclease III [Clostridia bacterium]